MTKRTGMGRLDERTGMMEIGRTERGEDEARVGVNNQSSILKILFY